MRHELLCVIAGLVTCVARVDGGATITIDHDWLTQTKARIAAGDPVVMPAYNQLLSRANQALALGPWSVTDDPENMPPSGNLHDFFQLGPYVWPDPDNPGEWVIIDGMQNPDNEMDAGAHWDMSDSTYRLATVYFLTGDEQYAEIAARNLRTWYVDPATAMTPRILMHIPPDRCKMIAPGSAERLCQDLDAARLLAESPHWLPSDQAGLEQWMSDYVAWLDTAPEPADERLFENNHGVWFDIHPVVTRLFLGRVQEAHAILANVGEKRIAVQMEPDGTLPGELGRADSLHYHEYVARGLEMLADISRHSGGPDIWNYVGPEGESITLLLDLMAPYSTGTPWPFFIGASFPVQPWNHEAMFRRAALALWEPAYEATASGVPDAHLPWLFNNWYAAPNVLGDVTGDWQVGFEDLTALLAAWGPCPNCSADLDENGQVGFEDLTALLLYFQS